MGNTETILNTEDYKSPCSFNIKLTLQFYNLPQPLILNSLLSGSIHIKTIFSLLKKGERGKKCLIYFYSRLLSCYSPISVSFSIPLSHGSFMYCSNQITTIGRVNGRSINPNTVGSKLIMGNLDVPHIDVASR